MAAGYWNCLFTIYYHIYLSLLDLFKHCIMVMEVAWILSIVQAVLDDNLALVRVLVGHGAGVNIADEDTWTPLHAAAANGNHGEPRV